jgi:hypothetical protein
VSPDDSGEELLKPMGQLLPGGRGITGFEHVLEKNQEWTQLDVVVFLQA